jgi:hypothetical protein
MLFALLMEMLLFSLCSAWFLNFILTPKGVVVIVFEHKQQKKTFDISAE